MNFIVKSETELGEKIFAAIKNHLRSGFKCGLSGDLGAGKTTLVKYIAKKLGIKDEVTSPTFTLQKTYPFNGKYLQHIDFYRLSPNSFDLSEIKEWLDDERAITFVEWPENLKLSPAVFDVFIRIEIVGQNKRKVSLKWK